MDLFLGYTNDCKLIGNRNIFVRGLSNDEKVNNYRVELKNSILLIKKWESFYKILQKYLFKLKKKNNNE